MSKLLLQLGTICLKLACHLILFLYEPNYEVFAMWLMVHVSISNNKIVKHQEDPKYHEPQRSDFLGLHEPRRTHEKPCSDELCTQNVIAHPGL